MTFYVNVGLCKFKSGYSQRLFRKFFILAKSLKPAAGAQFLQQLKNIRLKEIRKTEDSIMLRQAVLFLILVGTPLASAGYYGQMSGRAAAAHVYAANEAIQDMHLDQVSAGFGSYGGRMIVRVSGVYYVYAQVFFEPYSKRLRYNRIALVVGGSQFSLMQSAQVTSSQQGRADYGNSFTGGIVRLNSGDKIYLKALLPSKVWLHARHTFFGAYKLN